MAIIKQSTSYTRMVLLVQSSDHITGLTGASPTVTISKAGGAFAALGGTITEVSSGWYKIALNTTDTGTLGDLAYHITAASGDPTDFVDQVAANILGDTLPVNVTTWNGTAVSSPATAGIPDVNVKNMNNVAATSITAINANQGTTQPINFSGTGASAFVKSDVEQVNTQSASAAGTVTFPGTLASATNITAGTITTVTNLTNAATSGDFTATMKTSIGTAVAASAVASVTGNVGGNVTGSVGSVSGSVGGNVTGSVGSVSGSVGGNVTGSVGSVAGNVTGSVGSVTAAVTASGTSPLTEAYPAQGAALTLASALYTMTQFLGQHSTGGTTTWTLKKRDGSTTAKTYTLDSATAPTSITEAT